MAIWREALIKWKKKLERCDDEEIIVHTIHKLAKVPITVDLLQETGVGKIIRKLAKRDGQIGEKASHVLHKWRELVARSQKVNEKLAFDSRNETCHKKVSKREDVYTNVPESTVNKLCYKKPRSDEDSANDLEKLSRYKYEKTGSAISKRSTVSIESDCDSPNESVEPQHGLKTKDRCKKNNVKHSDNQVVKNSIDFLTKKDISNVLTKTNSKHKLPIVKQTNSETVQTHKSRNSTSHSSHQKNDSKKLKNSKIAIAGAEKRKLKSADAFTSSEVSFEACLGFNDIVALKKKKSSAKSCPSTSSKKIAKEAQAKDISCPKETPSLENVNVHKKSNSEKPRVCRSVMEEPSPVKLRVDVSSTLPEIQPNYKPLPHKDLNLVSSKRKVLSNEEAIMFTSSRKEKTVVYSGRRGPVLTEVPTLYDCCIRVLIDNIDAIEYMGSVPYFLLKPVLERCTPFQLYNLEDYNAYLLDDTHELWEKHCKRDFRCHTPGENETWRDMYWRVYEEQERKLKSITANISAAMSKSNPVRQVKLAYVDSAVKPPRDVARKQAKHGTAGPVNYFPKTETALKSPAIAACFTNSTSSSSASSSCSAAVPKKPKLAPLMAKTLKSMKQCYRRK